MQQRLAPEASEERLRKFSAELHAAEEAGFSGGFFYSPEALRKILTRFCEIIAENLHVQSCTVQLKLYDLLNSSLLRQLLDNEAKLLHDKEIAPPRGRNANSLMLWKNFSQKCKKRYYEIVGDGSDSTIDQIRFRQGLLKDSIIFPYALYPKGALWLVASNEKGPWAKCAPWLITDINRGIMTQIIQDKAARVRDRMTLRQTRSYRKLGSMDPYVWTNRPYAGHREDQKCPLYFFNYYGVPIRIHQRGDVIGILRVENKGLGAVKRKELKAPAAVTHLALRKVLAMPFGKSTGVEQIAEKLYRRLWTCKDEISNSNEFEPRDISLMSLVYLAYDLASARRHTDKTVGALCMLPYTSRRGPERNSRGRDLRPPVQVTFDNPEEERAFVNWLSGNDEDPKRRFNVVKQFYRVLNEAFSKPLTRKVNYTIKKALRNAIKVRKDGSHTNGSEPNIEKVEKTEPRSLLYSIYLDVPDHARFVIYLQVTPMRRELKNKTFAKLWNLSDETAKKYRKANDVYLTPGSDDWDFHLQTDRLAARVEALTFAFPIPKFTINDAWWLSWAALEIGKLIERQISYRGSNLSPTVPLTAMDFFRVPISDLSFVDTLRTQYKAAETVKGMLEYHIPNHCRELNLEVTLEHNCRVKNFRSYLERLGQEHRAYYDALIAIWLYILWLSLDPKTERVLTRALVDHKKTCKEQYLRKGLDYFSNLSHCKMLYEQTTSIVENLKKFDKALRDVCANESVLFSKEDVRWLQNSGDRVIGDLSFAAPNMGLCTERQYRIARKRLRQNIRTSPQAIPGSSSNELDDRQMDEKEITEYVFRRYDPFVMQAISLYILLNNALENNEHGKGYGPFYEKCRKLTRLLREKFESSHRLNEQWREVPKLVSPMKILIDELSKLRAQVSELSTSDFAAVIDSARSNLDPNKKSTSISDARLTSKGIYKRLRTLLNIAGNQVCPPLLNWETHRFDYVGARINCLFKNQVFAIYEHLWNRGDPFSHWTSEGQKQNRGNRQAERPWPKGGHARSEDEPSRQRWLSIQTKIHKGQDGYYAWQISALLDPKSVSKGYWGSSLYNINLLRDYLVSAFDRWHKDSATAYRRTATERTRLQDDYCRWFTRGYITHVLRKDPAAKEIEQAEDAYFPEYLLRTPLDIFIRLLETDHILKPDLKIMLDSLHEFIRRCLKKSNPNELWDVTQEIYSKARDLARRKYSEGKTHKRRTRGSRFLLNLQELEHALEGQLSVLDEEESRFEKLISKKSRSTKSPDKWPNRQAFEDETLLERIGDMRQLLESNENVTEIWRKGLRHVLIELQSQQKQHLFDIGELRSSQNVLDRIFCYVLLFDPGRSDKRFKDWSAHDLFYYVASLIPAELQVRTALADTMAEQYHGVYKSNVDPARDVAVQRRRLQEMGRKLDDLDRESEAIYDGYIVHSMLHAIKRNDKNI